MPEYKAPLRDMRFLLHEVFDVQSHYKSTGFGEVDREVVDAVVQEGAKFCEEVAAPLNQQGDEIGAKWADGNVTTPTGFDGIHKAFREGDWGSIAADPEYGGQGLPDSLELVFVDMATSANLSWRHCSGLTLGAIHALYAHGSEELKRQYLPKMISLEWSGTMCLTEPHAGSDVGILNTAATPNGDGSYAVTGTKIFITYGDHDLTNNIVHLVLARLPGAPAGPKGISLFLVPKFLPDADNNPGAANGVTTASIEKKHGIKGSPTCVLNFDEAKGFLVGKEHGGLRAMFTMMNYARIDVALHGLGQAERSFQDAVTYARERLQFRAPGGATHPDKNADPIIVHPDVRRMLLTQKAVTEGCRALAYYTAMQLDSEHRHETEEGRKSGAELLAFLIPITKGFLTEAGYEVTYWGVQVFGGHGYVRESGVEQYMRDCRIASIYEGTNAIQGNDLLQRKVLGSKGALLERFLSEVSGLCAEVECDENLAPLSSQLRSVVSRWRDVTDGVAKRAQDDPAEKGAAAFDYLMMSGYTVVGYMWLKMAQVAQAKLASGAAEQAFYTAKLQTAQFYFARLLPRAEMHAAAIGTGAANLMDMAEDAFIL